MCDQKLCRRGVCPRCNKWAYETTWAAVVGLKGFSVLAGVRFYLKTLGVEKWNILQRPEQSDPSDGFHSSL